MARIVRIWGPSKYSVKEHKVVWTFSTEHENGRTAMYRLAFYLDTRRFKTTHLGEDRQAKAYQQAMYTLLEPATGVFEGKVTDILKSRLPPEQLAEALALAIQHGRT